MTFKPADKDAMLKELAREDTNVDLDGSQWLFKSGKLDIGEGTHLDGHGSQVIADANAVRLWVDQDAPNVTIRNLKGAGYFTLYAYASGLTVEDVLIQHTLNGSTYLDLGAKGGATAAFMVWGRAGTTLRDLIFRRCTADRSYHHGFSLNLAGAQEGGGFANVLYEDCTSIGAGAVTVRDPNRIWACGLDAPDAGDIDGLTVRRFTGISPVQDGVHLDGSWTGHRQRQTNVLVEDCYLVACGARCPVESDEKFRSGIYMQNGTIRNVRTEDCAGAGFALKNQESKMLKIEGCQDTGSQYGMICEYGAPGAVVEFTSIGAKRKAFLGQVTQSGSLDLTIVDGPKDPILFGRTIRSDYVDCPNHAAEVAGKYAAYGYALDGSKIVIRYEGERPVYEVYSKSKMNGAPTFVHLEDGTIEIPDGTPEVPPIVLPPVAPVAAIVLGPYDAIRFSVPARGRDVALPDCLPAELRADFPDGRYVREV